MMEGNGVVTENPEIKESEVNYRAQNVLLFFGERLAIIIFSILVVFVGIFLVTQRAFSQDPGPLFVRENPEWFLNDVSFAVQENQFSEFLVSSKVLPTPTPTPFPVINSASDDVWERLADCESHKNWGANTGNGYYGGLQFSQGAWNSVGGTGLPSDATRDEQILRGNMLQAERGWVPWGMCSRKLGLI